MSARHLYQGPVGLGNPGGLRILPKDSPGMWVLAVPIAVAILRWVLIPWCPRPATSFPGVRVVVLHTPLVAGLWRWRGRLILGLRNRSCGRATHSNFCFALRRSVLHLAVAPEGRWRSQGGRGTDLFHSQTLLTVNRPPDGYFALGSHVRTAQRGKTTYNGEHAGHDAVFRSIIPAGHRWQARNQENADDKKNHYFLHKTLPF